MSLSGSEDSRCSSWATIRFATWSSTALPRKMIRSLSRREKMSNSRSPRAVRSMTIGTSGMPAILAGRWARLGGGADARPQAAHEPLGLAAQAAGVQPQRLRHLGGRRAVDEHRQQREVVGVHAMRGGVELGRVDWWQRAAAAGDDADRLEELAGVGGLVHQP